MARAVNTLEPNIMGTSFSLCWHCKNATGGCSWSRRFEPVENWTAVETSIKSVYGTNKDSYHVIDCPKFERG